MIDCNLNKELLLVTFQNNEITHMSVFNGFNNLVKFIFTDLNLSEEVFEEFDVESFRTNVELNMEEGTTLGMWIVYIQIASNFCKGQMLNYFENDGN